jgi:hypothetical protein
MKSCFSFLVTTFLSLTAFGLEARFTELSFQGSSFSFKISGNPNQYYHLESSSDLVVWSRISTPITDGNGVLDINFSVNKPQLFFRLEEVKRPELLIKVGIKVGTRIVSNKKNSLALSATLRAFNCPIRLEQVALGFTGSPGDVTGVSLWDDEIELGRGQFTGSDKTIVVPLYGSFVVDTDSDREILVKADFAKIGVGGSITNSGKLVALSLVGTNLSGSTRASSTITGESVDVSGGAFSMGVRVFKSIPLISKDETAGVLTDGENTLMRFRVEADESGGIGLGKFSLVIEASSEGLVSEPRVTFFSDPEYTQSLSISPELKVVTQGVNTWVTTKVFPLVKIDSEGSVYVQVSGYVNGSSEGSFVRTRLLSDNNPKSGRLPETSAFSWVWTPFSTTTTEEVADYFNSFGVPGIDCYQALSR